MREGDKTFIRRLAIQSQVGELMLSHSFIHIMWVFFAWITNLCYHEAGWPSGNIRFGLSQQIKTHVRMKDRNILIILSSQVTIPEEHAHQPASGLPCLESPQHAQAGLLPRTLQMLVRPADVVVAQHQDFRVQFHLKNYRLLSNAPRQQNYPQTIK